MSTQISATTRLSSSAKSRSIVPHLLQLILDLAVNTGSCYAGDVSLARMLAERIGRTVTDRRIRQAIAVLVTQGSIISERGPHGRQLRPVAITDPLPEPWKFPKKEKDKEKPKPKPTTTSSSETRAVQPVVVYEVRTVEVRTVQEAPRHPLEILMAKQAREDLRRYEAMRAAKKSLPRLPKGYNPFVKAAKTVAAAPIQTPPEPPKVAPVPIEPIQAPQSLPKLPPAQSVHAESGRPVQSTPEARSEAPRDPLVAKLQAQGYAGARKALEHYGPERVAVVLGMLEFSIAKGKRTGRKLDNPAGFLSRAFTENWQPGDDQVEAEKLREQVRERDQTIDFKARENARKRAEEKATEDCLSDPKVKEAVELQAAAEAAPYLEGLAGVRWEQMRRLHMAAARDAIARRMLGLSALTS